MRLHQLFEDESGSLSSARAGLWTTLALSIATIAVDVSLTMQGRHAIPNAVYALESTMFMAFATWAAGPRIAKYIGPQIGQVAQGVASAARDLRLPSREDDERHGGI